MNKREFIKYSALMAIGIGGKTSACLASNNIEINNSNKQIIFIDQSNSIHRWRNLCKEDDWTNAFNAAGKWAQENGGATIFIPKGIYFAQVTLFEGVYWVGEGRGITILTQPNNANRDIVISDNFDKLTGIGPLINAPKNFGISNLTIDGNYLSDYKGASINKDTTYNNKKGYGIKIFGSKFNIDVELVNCPEVGLYTEAVDYNNYGEEQDCKVDISGRVFGKEGIIHRGPSDIIYSHAFIGCVGWLATAEERDSKLVTSDIYLDEPVNVMVSDENLVNNSQYNGHHEFGILHLYGNVHGFGYKSMNSGRIKGEHLICENCRGGVYFSERSWGITNIIDCHNNGRLPLNLSNSLEAFPDIEIKSRQGLIITAVVRRTKVEARSYLALKSSGSFTNVKLSYFSIKPEANDSRIASIESSNSNYEIIIKNANSDAIFLSGEMNNVIINGANIINGTLLTINKGKNKTIKSNSVSLTVKNCDRILKSDVLPEAFDLKILGNIASNQLILSEDTPSANLENASTQINVKVSNKTIKKL